MFIPRKAYMWAAVVVILAAGALYLRHDAVRDDRRKEEARRLNAEAETHERIRNAISDPRTPDDIRQRLRNLAQ